MTEKTKTKAATAESEEMRVDKFLKVSRIIKRRTVAGEACGGGRIAVNGREAKPAHRVKPGDVLEISFGSRRLCVKILSVKEHALKADSSSMYEILSEE